MAGGHTNESKSTACTSGSASTRTRSGCSTSATTPSMRERLRATRAGERASHRWRRASGDPAPSRSPITTGVTGTSGPPTSPRTKTSPGSHAPTRGAWRPTPLARSSWRAPCWGRCSSDPGSSRPALQGRAQATLSGAGHRDPCAAAALTSKAAAPGATALLPALDVVLTLIDRVLDDAAVSTTSSAPTMRSGEGGTSSTCCQLCGAIRDGVIETDDFDIIDEWEYCDWLMHHGARESVDARRAVVGVRPGVRLRRRRPTSRGAARARRSAGSAAPSSATAARSCGR